MTNPATNLDRLHDPLLPPEVAWWPPAPGWYVVIAVLLCIVLAFSIRAVSRYRANAYRRAALRRLQSMDHNPAAIAEVLRRTALAIAPRTEIASMNSGEWVDWLTARSNSPIPDSVRAQLTTGIYAHPGTELGDVSALREFAAHWITQHRPPRC